MIRDKATDALLLGLAAITLVVVLVLGIGHAATPTSGASVPRMPAATVAQLRQASTNMASYCQGGGAWAEHKADGSWEVLGSCPR